MRSLPARSIIRNCIEIHEVSSHTPTLPHARTPNVDHSVLIYHPSKTPGIRESVFWGKISPFQAPFLFWINLSLPENPVKPPFSVRVENIPNNRSVCQNTADLHLTYWILRPFKSSWMELPDLPHPDPKTLPEHHYEALFFRRAF